jgi:hypothetical protein
MKPKKVLRCHDHKNEYLQPKFIRRYRRRKSA